MDFPHGQTVYRDRRQRITDPYNPTKSISGPWSAADTIPIDDAFVASSSSNTARDATRHQILTAKSLYCTDPTVDVLAGDRIRVGEATYQVDVKPTADVNPFTGWQPAIEIPLKEAAG